MPTKSWRGRCLVVAIAALAGLAWCRTGRGLANPQEDACAPTRPAITATKSYASIQNCVFCHKQGNVDIKTALCLCTEVKIWETEDKHKLAYQVLEGERSKRMGELLKIKPTEDGQCLSCHAVHITDPAVLERSNGAGFKISDGVSCLVCHGPYREWVVRHTPLGDPENWKKMTREQKEQQAGMYDLWDPARRTSICSSCHVGNTSENKVVTHDMYAAGHPPLPSFEIATFCEKMPRHWETMADKKKREVPPGAVTKQLGYDGVTLEQTRLTVESGVADLRAAMCLLAGEAKKCVGDDKRPEQSLDLAMFDCYACHHDLKSPSWRQQRGYTGAPGRPQFRPWPAALVRLGIRQAAQVDESRYKKYSQDFADGLKKLHEAFNAKPYGDCKQVAAAAEQLAQFSSGLLAEAAKQKYDEAAARQLLKELVTPPGVVDYDSARQIAWAFRIIYQEVNPKAAADSSVKKALEALDQELHLELPAGQKLNIIEELDKTLSKVAAYDPDKFAEKLKQLAAALNGEMR